MAASLYHLSGHQRCLCCWSQDRDRVFVQMGVFDGPVTEETAPTGKTSYAHDDVILCELCVAVANDLLPHRQDAVDQARADGDGLRRQVADLQAYVGKLELALAHRPEREDAVVTPKVQPVARPVVPDEHEPGESEELDAPKAASASDEESVASEPKVAPRRKPASRSSSKSKPKAGE